MTISKEDILVGISGLNGREDWPWDPTDEMNFQWRPRSKILSENKDEKQRVGSGTKGEKVKGGRVRYAGIILLPSRFFSFSSSFFSFPSFSLRPSRSPHPLTLAIKLTELIQISTVVRISFTEIGDGRKIAPRL